LQGIPDLSVAASWLVIASVSSFLLAASFSATSSSANLQALKNLWRNASNTYPGYWL